MIQPGASPTGYEKVAGTSIYDTLFIGAHVNRDYMMVPEPDQHSVSFFRESIWHHDLPRSIWQSPLPDSCYFDCEEVRVSVFGRRRAVTDWLSNPGVIFRFELSNRVYGERSLPSMLRLVERDQWGQLRARVTPDAARWLKGLRIPPKVYFQMQLRWAVPPKEVLRVGVEIEGTEWRCLY